MGRRRRRLRGRAGSEVNSSSSRAWKSQAGAAAAACLLYQQEKDGAMRADSPLLLLSHATSAPYKKACYYLLVGVSGNYYHRSSSLRLRASGGFSIRVAMACPTREVSHRVRRRCRRPRRRLRLRGLGRRPARAIGERERCVPARARGPFRRLGVVGAGSLAKGQSQAKPPRPRAAPRQWERTPRAHGRAAAAAGPRRTTWLEPGALSVRPRAHHHQSTTACVAPRLPTLPCLRPRAGEPLLLRCLLPPHYRSHLPTAARRNDDESTTTRGRALPSSVVLTPGDGAVVATRPERKARSSRFRHVALACPRCRAAGRDKPILLPHVAPAAHPDRPGGQSRKRSLLTFRCLLVLALGRIWYVGDTDHTDYCWMGRVYRERSNGSC